MILKSKAIRDLAKECKIPDHVVDSYFEQLTQLIWRAAKAERSFLRKKLRAWVMNQDIGKPPILDVLKDNDDDYELM